MVSGRSMRVRGRERTRYGYVVRSMVLMERKYREGWVVIVV